MYCESCGSIVNKGESFCSNCGARIPAPAPQPIQPNNFQQQPLYQQPVYQQQPYPANQQPLQNVQPIYQPVYQPIIVTPIKEPKRINGAATAGLIFGIIGIAISWIPFIDIWPALLGLIFSIIGVARKKAGGKGRAIAGLILSGITLLISVYYILVLIAGSSYSY